MAVARSELHEMTPAALHVHPLAHARSLLFVPATRPERFGKAIGSGADAVVLDLEDSVPAGEKPAARACVAETLHGLQCSRLPLVVRLNGSDTAAGQDDVEWFAALGPRAAAVALMLPKAETRASIERLAARLPDTTLLPIIESAAGFASVAEIASATNVLRLAVGHIDFMADTGLHCSAEEVELAPLRFAVAMATRLHRLATAIDGVTVDIADQCRLQEDTRRALRFGFGGKLCIHPRQIAVVHAAMAPSGDEIAWAERVVAADAASGGAAVQLDGRMVDAPVVLQACRLLARVRSSPTS